MHNSSCAPSSLNIATEFGDDQEAKKHVKGSSCSAVHFCGIDSNKLEVRVPLIQDWHYQTRCKVLFGLGLGSVNYFRRDALSLNTGYSEHTRMARTAGASAEYFFYLGFSASPKGLCGLKEWTYLKISCSCRTIQ